MNIIYDPSNTVTYPSWKCEKCGCSFYAGGGAIHRDDCPVADTGYKHCVPQVGDAIIDEAKKRLAEGKGGKPINGICPITPNQLVEAGLLKPACVTHD